MKLIKVEVNMNTGDVSRVYKQVLYDEDGNEVLGRTHRGGVIHAGEYDGEIEPEVMEICKKVHTPKLKAAQATRRKKAEKLGRKK